MMVEIKEDVGRGAARPAQDAAARVSEPSRAPLRDMRMVLLALWLGAALFMGAVLAPAAFSTLRARQVPYANEAAGSIVSRAVGVVNLSGFFVALLLLLLTLLLRRGRRGAAFVLELSALGLMAAATAVGQWVIAARMLSLRAQMGRPIDDVPADDPLRAAFDSLHGYSVKVAGVAMLAAVAALLLIAWRKKRY